MKIFQHSEALDQCERNIVGGGPIDMSDVVMLPVTLSRDISQSLCSSHHSSGLDWTGPLSSQLTI